MSSAREAEIRPFRPAGQDPHALSWHGGRSVFPLSIRLLSAGRRSPDGRFPAEISRPAARSREIMRTERECCGAPVEIRIVTMAEFHKNGSKQPFLWNCAATAARRNRKAVSSVDIKIKAATGKSTMLPPFLSVKIQAAVVILRKGPKKRVWTSEQKLEIFLYARSGGRVSGRRSLSAEVQCGKTPALPLRCPVPAGPWPRPDPLHTGYPPARSGYPGCRWSGCDYLP